MTRNSKILLSYWASMAVLIPAVVMLSLCWGRGLVLSPSEIFRPLNSLHETILHLRLLRILTAFLVGASLAVAGTGYQSVLRNPLAEPFILGISGGAGLGAMLAIAFGLNQISGLFIPLLAFVGAIAVMFAVLGLARGAGTEYADHIMLSGVIVGTLCSSILMFLISVVRMETLHSVTWWMLGSLEPSSAFLLRLVAVVTVLGGVTLFLLGREANVMSFGEELAWHLGIPPKLVLLLILGVSSLITACAVTISGIIGFVGLIVPHILRRILGADHRSLFPASMAGGGLFLVLCDLLARNLMYPRELPVGVITALLGGPFFLWLINRRGGERS